MNARETPERAPDAVADAVADAVSHAAPASILQPGRNCWRVERATRTRLVRDAAEYFALVRTAILHAEESLFLLGWDILAGLDLVPGGAPDGAPTQLAALLDFAARRRPRLHCYVLVWDHSTLYALERDPFTRLRLGWLTHRRVHFRFDDHHPLGGSHHEKVLVVDDRIAFSGSIDLTTHRWDTSAHAVDEPRRVNAMGSAYPPYHDVQLLVEGDAAAALGEFARARWQRLGWKRLPRFRPAQTTEAVAWLPPAPGDLRDAAIGIARTRPAFRGAPERRECEALFLDSIAAARDWIYLENQYFTDARIAAALARRLTEPEGPDVVVVGPQRCEGWLERNTMGVLRAAVVATLTASDHHGRLRVLHPMASRRADVATFVHSKVTIVDGELLRVGSANLARRSMGMDSECDLAVTSSGNAVTRAGILAMVHELLAEHLGVTGRQIADSWQTHRRLAPTIDALSGGDRTLVATPCADAATAPSESMRDLVDPNEPMGFVTKLASALPELESEQNRSRRVARTLPLLVVVATALLSWRVVAVTDRQFSDLTTLLNAAPESPFALFAATVALLVAGLTFLPLQLLTLSTAVILGPWVAGVAAFTGALAAAAAGYRVGAALTPQRLAQWIGTRVYRLLRLLHRPGALHVAALRALPIVSTTTLHLLCGAARVTPRAYWLGTVLGTFPTIAAACVVGGLLRRALLQREIWTGAAAGLLALVLITAMLRLRGRLLRQHAARSLESHDERARFG